MTDMTQLSRDYQRVEAAIAFLEDGFAHQPPLADIAAAAGLSEFHFQRLFSRWVGISPKRFLQFLTKEYARRLIQDSASVLEAAYDAGLSGAGRLHDLMVACEAATPGEIKQRGRGLTIAYGIHPSPFGDCLLAVTDRGICNLRFVPPGETAAMAAWLQAQWPRAVLRHDPAATAPLAARVFPGEPLEPPAPLHLHVRGTNFQIQVWQALLRIPLGRAVTYEDLARHIGLPGAARAVGNAVGRNPIPFLIPCHRVIRKMGIFGHYGEGPARKKAILGWEAARVHPAGPPEHRPA